MGFLSRDSSAVRYGTLIDIGSASVLVAIIRSDPNQLSPEIIWSKREYISLRSNNKVDNNPKLVLTCLVNALMLLDSEGRKTLREKKNINKLTNIQVTLSAPWSNTGTKTISYTHEDNFRISENLIDEMLRTSKMSASNESLIDEKLNVELDTIYAESLQGLYANGYPLRKPNNQSAQSLDIIASYAWTQAYIKNTIDESILKVIPEAETMMFPFILVYHYVINHLLPEFSDYYLVNITFEATEIAVVRDGILKHTAFCPAGAYTLAREISGVLGVPLDEAYSYLKEDAPLADIKLYSKSKIEEVDKILTTYRQALSELFKNTGDDLAIPKRIYLHDNINTEKFFAGQIEQAAKMTTRSSHAIYQVTDLIIDKSYDDIQEQTLKKGNFDTTLLLSAQFFHTKLYQERFD